MIQNRNRGQTVSVVLGHGTCGRRSKSYLVRVSVEVKILQETGGKLTEQEVVRVIDGPQAPVGIVVGAGAGAECPH